MSILTLAGLAVVAALLALMLKEHKADYAVYIGLSAGIAVLLLVLSDIEQVLTFLSGLSEMAGINDQEISLLFKALGIGYITQFAAEVCKDSGENGLSSKIELAGKVSILLLCLPVINSLLELVKTFLGS